MVVYDVNKNLDKYKKGEMISPLDLTKIIINLLRTARTWKQSRASLKICYAVGYIKPVEIAAGVNIADNIPCAMRRARTILGQKPGRILVLHVIDHDFIVRCIHNRLGTEEHIKKTLFLGARDKLQNLLRAEGMDVKGIEELIAIQKKEIKI